MRLTTNRRFFVKAVASIFLLCAVGALLASIHFLYTALRFNAVAEKATATVTEVGLDQWLEGRGSGRFGGGGPVPRESNIYYIQFRTQAGERVRTRIRRRQPLEGWSAGDPVTVFYDPRRATKARFSLHRSPWSSFLAGLLGFGLCLGFWQLILLMVTDD